MNYAVNKDAIIQITTHGVGKPMTLLHVVGDAAATSATGRSIPYDLGQGEGAADGGRLRRTASRCRLLALSGNGDDDDNAHGPAADVGADRRQAAASAGRQRHPHGALPRGRLPDAAPRPGPTTSPTRARSPPTSPICRTSSRCIPAGRTSAVDELFLKSQQENRPEQAAEQYKEIQEIYNEAAPIISLYETPYPVALPQEGQGLRADPARQQHLRSGLRREVEQSGLGRRAARRDPRGFTESGCIGRCTSQLHRDALLQIIPTFAPDRGRRLRASPGCCRAIRLSAMLGDRATDADVARHQRASSASTSSIFVAVLAFLRARLRAAISARRSPSSCR